MFEASDCQPRRLCADAASGEMGAADDANTSPPSPRPSPLTPAEGAALPTRQRNALRHLLDQATISPADVARLSYRALERAPGIGKQSLEIIIAWLRAHGLEPAGQPTPSSNPRVLQRQRKLDRAIRLLRENGYEVRRGDGPKASA